MTLKIMTVVGTRPEIIRLSRLIPLLDQNFEHLLVHTGQNHDPNLSQVFFDELRVRSPDYYLGIDTSTLGRSLGSTLASIEEVLKKELPDALVILGDTNSAIAAVISERLFIPVYHLEAGNRSFDPMVPEELNRRMVDHVATYNLAYNDFSYQNLVREGKHPNTLAKTGSPMKEVLSHYASEIHQSEALSKLGLKKENYLLVSLHRQENVDYPQRLQAILSEIVGAADQLEMPVLMSVHPRTRLRLRDSSIEENSNLIFHEPFGFFDFVHLQTQAYCVLSDSGTISEESAILGFDAITIRDFFERPEALVTARISLLQPGSHSLFKQIQNSKVRNSSAAQIPDGYQVGDFSQRVVHFIHSTIHRARRAFLVHGA